MSEKRPPDDLSELLKSYNPPPEFPRESLETAIFDPAPTAADGAARWGRYSRALRAIAAALVVFLGGVLVGRSSTTGEDEDRRAGSEKATLPVVRPAASELGELPGDGAHRVIWF